MNSLFERPQLTGLVQRLQEPRRFLQVLAGPRQVGKSTLVRQALARLSASPGLAQHSASADGAAAPGRVWLSSQWEAARLLAAQAGACVLVLDEIQHVAQWTREVKRLWDEDRAAGRDLRVVILGSAPLLIARELSESMAGRFEVTRLGHWRFSEMREAFGLSLDEFVFYGGYPGAAELIGQPRRWASYVNDALIETTLGKDVLMLAPVLKPALMHRVFDLARRYSGQILSYQKMMGQLDDAGNTTTLAHYLSLLEAAGIVCGLQKFAGQVVRQRGSSPKLQVFNTALMGAASVLAGEDLSTVRQSPERWGRFVESAVGAELLARHPEHSSLAPVIRYWNKGQQEVDFVVQQGQDLLAIEVKSGLASRPVPGLEAFLKLTPAARPIRLGTGGMPLELWFGA
ncbi:MAG: hypothetical protein RLZ51_700 [Pseudomonadota bacterium]|jgi:predicted AAA+ superfamily ATPase